MPQGRGLGNPASARCLSWRRPEEEGEVEAVESREGGADAGPEVEAAAPDARASTTRLSEVRPE